MNAQDLKNSILQLAIQGKLVEQREEEGTAKELLENIKAENTKLIKEGKIKKQKALSQIEVNEIPFDIPSNWTWARLGEVLDIARGGSPRPIKEYITDSEDGVNWIKIGDTDKGGKYISSTSQKIIKEGVKKSRFVRKGDFLLSNSMSYGRPYILNIDGCIHDGWLVLSQRFEIFNTNYLYHLLSSKMVFNQFSSIVSGAVVNNLNAEKVRQTVIPIPPINEQNRIIIKIEELLLHVDKYDVAYSEVEELNKTFPEDMQKSILQYAIQGKLVEQREEDGTAEELYKQIQEEKKKLIKEGKIKKTKALPEITEDEIPFDIPKNWKWVRLGEIGSWSSGATPSRSNPKYYGGEIPWLKTGDLNDGYIVEVPEYITEEALNKTSVRLNPIGSVLMAMYGATIGKLGILDIEATTNQACCACIPFKGIYNKFLFYYLLGQRGYYIKMGAGGAQPNISKEKIVSSILPLPPLEEQKRIVEKIEELLPYANQLIKKVD